MNAEDWKEFKEHKKELKEKNNARYIPMLEHAGAEFKTEGVYRIGDYDCYPGRGWARNYRTNKYKKIEEVLELKYIMEMEFDSEDLCPYRICDYIYSNLRSLELSRYLTGKILRGATKFKLTIEENNNEE